MIKKTYKILSNKFNIYINKFLSLAQKKVSFDDIYKKEIKKSKPLIFDVGASNGESITRFKRIFPEATIHSFEPIYESCKLLKTKYEDSKDIIINNFGLGSKKGRESFYLNYKQNTSSFLKINQNSDWAKIRSSQRNIDVSEFSKELKNIPLETIDNYTFQNNINQIDLLKIDTQGFEDQVLSGSKKSIELNKIRFIETEIILSDVYEKKLSFYDIEKHFENTSFELIAINNGNSNIYETYSLNLDLLYLNRSYDNKAF